MHPKPLFMIRLCNKSAYSVSYINVIFNKCNVIYNNKQWHLQSVFQMSRLRLYKRRVPEYYVKIKQYLIHENDVKVNKVLSYFEALTHV